MDICAINRSRSLTPEKRLPVVRNRMVKHPRVLDKRHRQSILSGKCVDISSKANSTPPIGAPKAAAKPVPAAMLIKFLR